MNFLVIQTNYTQVPDYQKATQGNSKKIKHIHEFFSQFLIELDLTYSMLLWVAAAAIGILVTFILIFKYTKTGKNDVIGYSSKCKKCGEETNGLKCPKCESVKKDWR